ncbi:MAG: protease pro-enzyme activation domain-containing protein [Verrucomicrobiota bacterium]
MVTSGPAQAAPQVLRGHVPPITKQLTAIGRLDSSRQLDLAIGLPLRNSDQLTNLLQELYEPSSGNFRRFLTPDQFASSFGPSQEDYQAVIDFAKSHGLIVKRTHSNRTLLDVGGSVADIEKAFHVHMRIYQHPVESRTFFAPDTEPSLDLDTPVLAISGLDDYVIPRPQIHPMVHPLGGGSGGGGGGGGGGGSGSGGLYLGPDFRAAYAPGVTLDGTGQSVGLFELTGYDPDDISDYESEAGMNGVPLQNILIDGFDGDDTNVDYAIEATADIEMAMSMAPNLDDILVYEGPTPLYEAPLGTNAIQYADTTAQINDVFDQMATDDKAKQLSCSYQMDINLSTVQIFEQFAAQGQSLFQGSGDFGAYPGAIDEPADDPYLTVVGGTTLSTTGPAGSWVSETVWLTPATSDPLLGNTPEEASGGGVSLTYNIPDWQQGISMTANQGSTTMRNLPDVALVANNVDVVWGNDYIGSSYDLPEAGTSLATPLWAGFMALVNQQAAANGQPPVGFANPALYAIGKSTSYNSCFNDITTGNNFDPGSPSKYNATVGYDLCSGWGTIIGSNLIQELLAPPSENLVITPPLGFTSSGPGGGPFSVTSQTYTLANIGAKPLNWSLVNTSVWLNVSPTSGTLNSGGSATVTVSLNSTANNFLIATRSGNVAISDITDGMTQNRQFDLYVGNGGFESGDFTGWDYVGSTNLSFALAADDVDVAGTNALNGEADVLFVHSGLYGAYLGQYPTDGSLSQTVATKTGQQYLVSFWLTSVPYQGVTIPNDFAAKWGGSTLYAQTNLDAFGWTNMQFVVPATSANTTLQFDFNNVPGAFGLDDVSVGIVPAPVFQSATMTAGALTFTWSGIANVSYQIQSSTSLVEPNWTNMASPITATGSTVTTMEPTGAEPQRYYRVILLPPP